MIYYSEYDCIYSAEGNIINEDRNISIQVPIDHYACFSQILNLIRGCDNADIKYKIYLYANDLEEKNYNICTLKETKKILRAFKKVVPFTFFFTKEKYTCGKYSKKQVLFNVLNINIQGNYPQHLWLTTMTRCFTEFPYNVAAKEACRIQSNKEDLNCIKLNWINLYNITISILGGDSLHGFICNKEQKLRTYRELKEFIKGRSSNVFSLAQELCSTGHPFKGNYLVYIDSEDTLNKSLKKLTSKYISAYKEKTKWRD